MSVGNLETWADLGRRAALALERPGRADGPDVGAVFRFHKSGQLSISVGGNTIGTFLPDGDMENALELARQSVEALEARQKENRSIPAHLTDLAERIYEASVEDGYDRNSSVSEDRYVGYLVGLQYNSHMIEMWGLAPLLANAMAGAAGVGEDHPARDAAVEAILLASAEFDHPDPSEPGDKVRIGISVNAEMMESWTFNTRLIAGAIAESLAPLIGLAPDVAKPEATL